MIFWSPVDFIIAIAGSVSLVVVALGVLTAIQEWLERKLIKWWTGKDDPNH